MRHILFLFCLMPFFLYGQSETPFGKQLSALQEALVTKNPDPLKPYLSPNLSIAGLEGEKALSVLKPILLAMPPVKTVSLIKADTTECFELSVRLSSADTGYIRTVKLDREHRFISLDLIKVEVKKVKFGELRITGEDYVEVPFRQIGKWVVLENVRFNGKKGNFVIDNAAQAFVVNSRFMQTDTIYATGILNGIAGVKSAKTSILDIDTLQIHSLRITGTQAIVQDLSHLEKKVKTPIDGILGYPLLKNYEVHFDFRRHKLCFYKLDETGNPLVTPYPEKPVFVLPFEIHRNFLPVFETEYGPLRLKTIFDSGASTNIISREIFEKMPPQLYKKPRKSKIYGIHQDTLHTRSINFPEIRIRNYALKNLRHRVVSLSHFDGIDAILGYELMRKNHRLSLNYKRKEIRLYKGMRSLSSFSTTH